MNIIDFGETLYATSPAPTPEQYDDAWTYVSTHAPDLLEAIFGSNR